MIVSAMRSYPLLFPFLLFWIGASAFARWVALPVLTGATEGRGFQSLYELYFGGRSEAAGSAFDFWSQTANAVPIAGVLHLAVILFIAHLAWKHESAAPSSGTRGAVDLILILFSAVFLLASIPLWVPSDYFAYIDEWTVVLEGRNPWTSAGHFNAYGPLFNALAPLNWLHPLANKLLFAFAYVVFVVWLIKDHGSRHGLAMVSWQVAVIWLFNPFVWIEIAYFGHFDVVVALACVTAVHFCALRKDIASGISLAAGVLLKYIPVVILPFLIIDKLRLRWRLLVSCAAVILSGFLLSVSIWGASTFSPLLFVASRETNGSIYEFLNRTPSLVEILNLPFRSVWDTPNVDFLALPCLVIAGLAIFGWCAINRTEPVLSAVLALLVTFLFYHVGYINYEMILFFVASYWVVSEWTKLKNEILIRASLIAHFGVLAAIDIAIVFEFVGYASYGRVFILLKFLTGCALLVGLMRFSAHKLAKELHLEKQQ